MSLLNEPCNQVDQLSFGHNLIKLHPLATSVEVDHDKKVIYLNVTNLDIWYARNLPVEFEGYKVVGRLDNHVLSTFMEEPHPLIVNTDEFYITNYKCFPHPQKYRKERGFVDFNFPINEVDINQYVGFACCVLFAIVLLKFDCKF